MNRLLSLWVLSNREAPYYALVVPDAGVNPRTYAPEEKRSLGLEARWFGGLTFQPPGLLTEGSPQELAEYMRAHPEVLATKDQRAAYRRGEQPC